MGAFVFGLSDDILCGQFSIGAGHNGVKKYSYCPRNGL